MKKLFSSQLICITKAAQDALYMAKCNHSETIPFISRNAHARAPSPVKNNTAHSLPQRDALARATNRALDTIVIVFHKQIGEMIRRVFPILFTPRLN